jgi:hypothetical protein
MAETNDGTFASYAGRVVFPRTPADLRSTAHCPACFTPLRTAVCSSCGLDLAHASAAELAETSADIAARLDTRVALIGRIRFDTAQALSARKKAELEAARAAAFAKAAAEAAAPPPPPLVVAAAAPPLATVPAPPAPTWTPPAQAPVSTRRRSSIQVLLLIAGVSLLSLAAVLFLVFAFVNYGLAVRSLIIGLVTVATFVIASLLRKRGLVGTAEGIAVFAVVLVFLDSYAVRSNNLLGAAGPSDESYWGATLLLAAVGFIVWQRFSKLRVASVAGFASLAPGAGLLVAGIAAPLETTATVFLSAATVAITALAHPLAKRPDAFGLPERIIMLSTAAIALAVAFFPPFGFESAVVAALAFVALAVIAAAHTVVAVGADHRALTVFGRAFAAFGGFIAALTLVPTAPHIDVDVDAQLAYIVIAPLAVAAFATLALDTVRHRTSGRARASLTPATLGALVVSASITAGMALASLPAVAETLSVGARGAWATTSTSQIRQPGTLEVSALAALTVVVVLAVLASVASRRLMSRSSALLGAALLVATLAVPALGTAPAIVAGWLGIAAVAAAALVSKRGSTSARVIVAVAAIVTLSFGYLTSWASFETRVPGAVAVVVILVAARFAVRATSIVRRAVLLVIAASIALVAVADYPQFTAEALGYTTDLDSLRFLAVAAIGLAVLSAIPVVPGLTIVDRRALFWTSVPLASVTLFALWGNVGAETAQPLVSLAGAIALVASLVVWIVVRRSGEVTAERVLASIALAPVGFWMLDALTRVLDLPAIASDITAITATLLVAAIALVVTIVHPSGTPRIAREIGVVLVAVPAVSTAIVLDSDSTWLILVLAGVTTLLLAISPDGLFGSRSGRKQLGWLALGFVTAGLWWRLSSDSVEALEPYVLPLAGALLLVAVFVWRTTRTSLAAPVIALGGLLVAIVPLAVASATGPVERAYIVGGIAALLALGGTFAPGASPLRRYLDVASVAGSIGVLLVAAGRAYELTIAVGTPDGQLDAWVGAAAAVLFATALGHSITPSTDDTRLVLGHVLSILSLALLVGFQLAAIDDSDFGRLRIIEAIALTAIVHIVALTINRGVLALPLACAAMFFTVLTAFTALRAISILEITGLLVLVALSSSLVALVVTLLDSSRRPRWQREIALPVFAALLVSAAIAAGSHDDATWLILVIAGVVALILSISTDGLFGSQSNRKHVGWLALALAVGGLWWRLVGIGVESVEPYVLPLAGALLLVALLAWRAQRTSDERGAAPLIVLGALLIAILPLALNAATGDLSRAIIVAAVSAALLLTGSLLVANARLRPYLDAAALAGFVGVIVVTVGRAWFISVESRTDDASLDAWLGGALLVLLAAAFGQARARLGDNPRLRSAASQSLGIVALTVVLVFTISNLAADGIPQLRAFAVVLVFSLIHVIAILVDAAPLSRLLAWVALAFAGATALSGIVVGALDPLEAGTIPLAFALVASGVVQLVRDDTARSWPNLGPGLLVLFAPSLLASMGDDRLLWRVAAIAVLGIVAIIVGLLRKLQAPFIIGALATIVVTITTFAPQIRETYELRAWLVWIIIGAIGGTLLVVFAARFERSIQNIRDTITRVRELR